LNRQDGATEINLYVRYYSCRTTRYIVSRLSRSSRAVQFCAFCTRSASIFYRTASFLNMVKRLHPCFI